MASLEKIYEIEQKLANGDILIIHPKTVANAVDESSDRKWMSESERNKLAGIESGAQVNTINSVIVEKQESADNGYASTYVIKVNGSQVGDKINIPKDLVVESGTVKVCVEDNSPVEGYVSGDKYIDLVIANSSDAHLYIKVSDLVDKVTSSVTGSGNVVTDVTIEGNVIKVTKGTVDTTLPDIATAGTYSAVQVNSKGLVVAGAQVIEVGESGQISPSDSLVIGGIFFEEV